MIAGTSSDHLQISQYQSRTDRGPTSTNPRQPGTSQRQSRTDRGPASTNHAHTGDQPVLIMHPSVSDGEWSGVNWKTARCYSHRGQHAHISLVHTHAHRYRKMVLCMYLYTHSISQYNGVTQYSCTDEMTGKYHDCIDMLAIKLNASL